MRKGTENASFFASGGSCKICIWGRMAASPTRAIISPIRVTRPTFSRFVLDLFFFLFRGRCDIGVILDGVSSRSLHCVRRRNDLVGLRETMKSEYREGPKAKKTSRRLWRRFSAPRRIQGKVSQSQRKRSWVPPRIKRALVAFPSPLAFGGAVIL